MQTWNSSFLTAVLEYVADLTKLLLWWLFLSEDEWMHVFFQLVLAVSTFVSSSCDKGIKPQQDEIVPHVSVEQKDKKHEMSSE